MYVYVCMSMRAYVRVHVYVPMYMCMCICICVNVYVCMYVWIYVYVYVCICMCICVCVYVCVYVCIRKRRYLYISYILYICDILVLYKFSIIINPASWLPHANKEYLLYPTSLNKNEGF